jgi:hypothetical protein
VPQKYFTLAETDLELTKRHLPALTRWSPNRPFVIADGLFSAEPTAALSSQILRNRSIDADSR